MSQYSKDNSRNITIILLGNYIFINFLFLFVFKIFLFLNTMTNNICHVSNLTWTNIKNLWWESCINLSPVLHLLEQYQYVYCLDSKVLKVISVYRKSYKLNHQIMWPCIVQYDNGPPKYCQTPPWIVSSWDDLRLTIDVGPVMTAKILQYNEEIIHHSTCMPFTVWGSNQCMD